MCVDEASNFSVTGVENPAALEAGLASIARKAVKPAAQLITQNMTIGDHQIVIAEIIGLPSSDKPAYFEGRAYLRQADGDYAMHQHEIRMLEEEKSRLSKRYTHDLTAITSADSSELLPELLSTYISQVRRTDRRLADRSDDEILARTHIIHNNHPTLAGLYACGDYPQESLAALSITAAVVAPDNQGKRRTISLEEFTGPIPILLDNVMDWCATNIPLVRRYDSDGHMSETPELPLSAIRELVANALVHRDLSSNTLETGKSIQVRLYNDRLMIQSPGGLRGISLQQLESTTHAQAAVNRHLYAITRRLRTQDGAPIIEGEGGGIREVFRACEEAKLHRPLLQDTGVQFQAFLFRPTILSPWGTPSDERNTHTSSRNEHYILAAFHGSEVLTFNKLVSRIADLSIGQIRYALQHAVKAGTVIQDGGQGKRDTTYRLP